MLTFLTPRRAVGLPIWVAAAMVSLGSVSARADETVQELPKPKVSINLSAELLNDVFGVTNAALAGVVQAMNEHQEGGEAVRLTAEQLGAAKQVIELATDAVQGVRLRVYSDLEPAAAEALVAHHNASLDGEGWERVVEVNDNKECVRIALRNDSHAVRGVRIIAGSGKETITIDADCDLSPERAEQLTRTATKIALEFGLEDVLEEVVEEVRREFERNVK